MLEEPYVVSNKAQEIASSLRALAQGYEVLYDSAFINRKKGSSGDRAKGSISDSTASIMLSRQKLRSLLNRVAKTIINTESDLKGALGDLQSAFDLEDQGVVDEKGPFPKIISTEEYKQKIAKKR